MKKKILSLFLAAIMVASSVPFGTLVASAASYTCGTCNGSGYSGTYMGYGSCGNCSGKGYIPSYGGSIYFCEECKEEVSTYIPSGGSTVNKDRRCSQCGWTWVHLGRTCSRCYGAGETYGTQNRKCTTCNGSGKVDNCNHAGMKSCDASCKTCGFTQTPQHKYINECDAYCANCYAYRIVEDKYHKYKETGRAPATCESMGWIEYKCTSCGLGYREILSKTKHEYSNSCDDECNNCGKERAASHSYSSSCDRYCNICDDVRDARHKYTWKITLATQSKNGKIVATCRECGYTKKSTKIYAAKTVKLSAKSYTYSGLAKKPTVKVYDSAGKLISSSNYTVSYKNNKNVGKATATITFKGNYSGTKTLTFTINPKSTSVSKLTAAKKSLKVSIKKQSKQVTGYEVQYSTSKKFKKAKTTTVKNYKKTSVTLKKLSAKKTYYVRVRTYKIVKGKKFYSGWSKVKVKKTK